MLVVVTLLVCHDRLRIMQQDIELLDYGIQENKYLVVFELHAFHFSCIMETTEHFLCNDKMSITWLQNHKHFSVNSPIFGKICAQIGNFRSHEFQCKWQIFP